MRAFLPDNQPYINLATQRWRRLLIRQEQGRLKEWERICPDGNFNRVFARIREDACIDAWYHDLRKTGITIMNRNLSLPETREIAGHSSSETTDIYLGIRPDYITRALNSFDGA
jgi:integrase